LLYDWFNNFPHAKSQQRFIKRVQVKTATSKTATRPKRRHAKTATNQNGDNQIGDTIKQRRFGCVAVLVVDALDLSPF